MPESLQSSVMVINLIIHNVAIVKLLTFTLKNIDFKDALSKKTPSAIPVPAATAPAAGNPAPAPADVSTSYSRIVGTIGSIVLAAFFWALGNIILYKAFADVSGIQQLLSGLGAYFFAGSALFVPYAFNQLRSAFS